MARATALEIAERIDHHQARRTNTTCSVRSVELLSLVSTPGAAHQAAADDQTPRHRNVDQPAEDRLAMLLSA